MARLQAATSSNNSGTVSVTLPTVSLGLNGAGTASNCAVIDFIGYYNQVIPTGGVTQTYLLTNPVGVGSTVLVGETAIAAQGGGFTLIFPDGMGPRLHNGASNPTVVCGVVDAAGAYVTCLNQRCVVGYHTEPM